MKTLSALKVLVVEDEALVSMLVEDMLTDLGCTIVGPAAEIEEALKLATSADIDAALLDVNLGGAGRSSRSRTPCARAACPTPSPAAMARPASAKTTRAPRSCRSPSARPTCAASWKAWSARRRDRLIAFRYSAHSAGA